MDGAHFLRGFPRELAIGLEVGDGWGRLEPPGADVRAHLVQPLVHVLRIVRTVFVNERAQCIYDSAGKDLVRAFG